MKTKSKFGLKKIGAKARRLGIPLTASCATGCSWGWRMR